MDILNENLDYRSMNMMLQYLAAYGIDHHSRAIQHLMKVFVDKSFTNLNMYLESRLLQTDHIARIKKSSVRRDRDPIGTCISSLCIND